MKENKKNLSGKIITLIGIGLFVVQYPLSLIGEWGETFGGMLRILGIILFIIGLIRWRKETKWGGKIMWNRKIKKDKK